MWMKNAKALFALTAHTIFTYYACVNAVAAGATVRSLALLEKFIIYTYKLCRRRGGSGDGEKLLSSQKAVDRGNGVLRVYIKIHIYVYLPIVLSWCAA